MSRRLRMRSGAPIAQKGVMLLEALIGILIFSLGVLGIVAMQATAIARLTDAKYRTEAAHLADRMIGTIWANRGTNVPTLAADWATEISGGATPLLPNGESWVEVRPPRQCARVRACMCARACVRVGARASLQRVCVIA